ncbi:MAG TPA: hypothetical protein VGE37_01685, partial [Archangium sp.]
TFALSRRFAWIAPQLIARWAALVIASVAVLVLVPPSGIAVFSVQVAAWLALELSDRKPAPRTWLWWMIGCFVAGFAFWIADKTRFVCDPDNHLINGHAVWHVATSICLALFYEYEASRRD